MTNETSKNDATDAMDVDAAPSETPQKIEMTLMDKLMSNVGLIHEAARAKETRLISSRLLRSTHGLKKDLSAQGIVEFVTRLFGNDGTEAMDDGSAQPRAILERIKKVLDDCEALADGGSLDWAAPAAGTAMIDDQGDAKHDSGGKDVIAAPSASVTAVHPEFSELYVYLITCMLLVDKCAWADAFKLSQVGIELSMNVNARVVDPMSSRLCSIFSLAAEKLGMLDQIRGTLLQLHRAAVLRHDGIGQETLLNLLLRNYLAYKLYNQAEALRAKAQPDVYKSSAQHCRLLYYHGRIQAVLLEYSDAKEALVQASRKAPQAARGFRLQVAKWLAVVRLLLGEVPSRSELAPADLRSMMTPYFELARAVGRGDVNTFNDVAAKYQADFERDDLRHVVARLRSNVIRAGVRRIASAYCRISLEDISKKLGLSNVSDAEYIVAKAIRDGGIVAKLDHESGIMTCPSISDVYSTDEPLNAFHARIAFCLDIHNEAVMAIRHDHVSTKKHWNDNTKDGSEGITLEDALDAFYEDY